MEDRHIKIKKTGEGIYGVVYKGRHKTTGQVVAMKKIRLETLLKELRHPNIVGLQDVLMQDSRLYLIFEFLAMDLKKCLGSIPSGQVYGFFTFLHRDLKPQNLLMDDKGTIKLADFGLARALGIPVRAHTRGVAMLWCSSREELRGRGYSTPADIWSVGTIFAELATEKPLFHGGSETDQLFRIFQMWPEVESLQDYKNTFPKWKPGSLASHVKNLDEHGLDLLSKMLVYDPAKRILRHPYLDDLDDQTRKM
uniref:Protein kinase domain-containing protein n=1 Tax=Jaculus jaculus TaxID=51337 RepID=A0A8C5KLY8_JACJA